MTAAEAPDRLNEGTEAVQPSIPPMDPVSRRIRQEMRRKRKEEDQSHLSDFFGGTWQPKGGSP